MTLPEVCRRLGKSRAWGERVVFEYREQLPQPVRIGNARVWPDELVDMLQEIAAREERCAAGGR